MQSDFQRFFAWGVLTPLVAPIFLIIIFYYGDNNPIYLRTILGRPAFLLFAAALLGESYAETLSVDQPTDNIRKFVYSISNMFIPLSLIVTASLYGWAEANPVHYQTRLLAICVVALVSISILAEFATRLCYNKVVQVPSEADSSGREGENHADSNQ